MSVKCHNCEALREEIKDLNASLAAYEAEYEPSFRLPEYPFLPFTVNESYVLQVMYKRLGQFVNMKAVMDGRPRKHVQDFASDGRAASVVACHVRRRLKGTIYDVENRFGGGYRLIRRQDPALTTSTISAPAPSIPSARPAACPTPASAAGSGRRVSVS